LLRADERKARELVSSEASLKTNGLRLTWRWPKYSAPTSAQSRSEAILIAEKRSAEFPDTPTIVEFVKDESTRQQLDLLMVSQGLDRPVMLPPGVAAGRVEELRQAFDATMADAAFRLDVEKRNLHVDPVGGEAMAGALARAFALPADVIAGAREMMGGR
jgi:tripartite-type tricarboxylate transporter receptor subunit TctC